MTLVNAIRLTGVKILKALLSPIEFRGKRSILSALCPHQGEINIHLFGYSFTCDLSELIQRNIFLFNYDEDAQLFVRKRLHPGDTFVDAGANVGFYTLLAASIVGERGKVIAIEPNPKPFLKLKRVIEKNNITNVILLNVALGKEPGTCNLFLNPEYGCDTATMVAHDAPESILVEVQPLDSVVATHQIERIDYLKVDVEGFEPDVLAGAKKLLSERRIGVIQCEFCEFWLERNSSSPERLHRFLIESGFTDADGPPQFAKNCIVERFFISTKDDAAKISA